MAVVMLLMKLAHIWSGTVINLHMLKIKSREQVAFIRLEQLREFGEHSYKQASREKVRFRLMSLHEVDRVLVFQYSD